AGEDGLPGGVVVLAGEDVAGHDRSQQREDPAGGEAEREQRDGVAALVDVAAEEAVLGRALLAVDDQDDQRRRDQAEEQCGARAELGGELGRLPDDRVEERRPTPLAQGQWSPGRDLGGGAHAAASSASSTGTPPGADSVSMKKSASSGASE